MATAALQRKPRTLDRRIRAAVNPPPGLAERALDIADRQVKLLSRPVDDLMEVSGIARGRIALPKETVGLDRRPHEASVRVEPQSRRAHAPAADPFEPSP